MLKRKLFFVVVLSFLLFFTGLFSITSLTLSPSLNQWDDSTGFGINLSADFMPFFFGNNSFLRLALGANKVNKNDFSMSRYTALVGAGYDWQPISTFPMHLKPYLLIGYCIGHRFDDSGNDAILMGAVISPQIDIIFDLSQKIGLGVGLGYNNFLNGDFVGSYLSISANVSYRFGRLTSKGKSSKKDMSVNFKKAFKKGKLALNITKVGKKEVQLNIPNVLFGANETDLKPSFISVFRDVAKIIKSKKGISLIIEGYTDNVGAKKMNLDLSVTRANNVKKVFVKFGLSPSQIKTKGYGMSNPIAPNDTPENRAKNRRVVIRVITK